MGKEELSRNIGAIVAELGYECVNAALVTEEGRSTVRVMIDTLGGIDVSDCERVSKAVNRYLDGEGIAESDRLNGRYYLEVSSPGVERPLFTPADYERFKGREARVRTFDFLDGRKTHVGFIAEANEASVLLETEQGACSIPFGAVARATLVFRGLEPREPKKPAKNARPAKPAKKGGKRVPETLIDKTATGQEEH
ncbi:MAG: ribosome maturation factor RimP [Synergistaceae bacterium]|nr:ribosome maturation factor RimP [Synergistaceae bacterium]